MKFENILLEDKRTFFRILAHYILFRFDPIYTFFYPSIFMPFHIKISLFFFELSLSFCFNAILLSDEYITPIGIITFSEFQIHAMILSLFASLIAPFGGFFASGFKRAIKIKVFID